jgi:DNA helicase-2/ATP-dependent DNA helicase PcrA
MNVDEGELTRVQRTAVEHIDGPLLILAGPGSGKTRVVTHRIAHLLDQDVPDDQVVALTFTNKAAEEMRARVERLVPDRAVWVSTFHRFCARLLRSYAPQVGLDRGFTIYDTSDSLRALKHVLETGPHDVHPFSPPQVASEISWAKNNLIGADQYEPRIGKPIQAAVAQIYGPYRKKLLDSSAVDFDDLLLHVATLLRENPEIRQSLDQRFRYILVDEYQDTNLAQYAILRALSHDYPNLAATGDPDQSIFGWRGANLNNILGFENDFPDVRVVRLEQNYRSTKNILRVADALIANNVRRKHKQLFTENDAGRPVQLVCYPTAKDESEAIVARIASDIANGRRRARDFAILYRTNALSRSLEMAFAEFGVPYQLVRGVEFFHRKEVKDVLAYLQLVNNPRDDVALRRTINTPARGIGKKSLDELVAYAHRRGMPLLDAAMAAEEISTLSKRAVSALRTFTAVIDQLALRITSPLEEVVGLVLSLTSYREHLESSGSDEDMDRLANIEELLTVAREFDERCGEDANLEMFLEQIALVNDTDEWTQSVDRVTLMTLHAAKGLEFPIVFMIAVEDKLLPHDRGRDDPNEVEEERRLMFVGMTRAERELHLSMARRRDFRGQRRTSAPSPFLMELPRNEMEVIDLGWTQYDHDEPEIEEPQYRSRPSSRSASSDLDEVPALTTAAELASGKQAVANAAAIDVEVFHVGMPVTHPEYGLGKIAALSGRGPKRIATVNFATSGQHRFRLKESSLVPAGGQSSQT